MHNPNLPASDSIALDSIASLFPVAPGELLWGRNLTRRTDTKYLVPTGCLAGLLSTVRHDYAVLGTPSSRVATYHSLYFETPELRCFHDHRRGRHARHKVRIRHYPERRLTFLEIKTKRTECITIKARLARPYGDCSLDAEAREFVRAHADLPAASLRPQVWVAYTRLSLLALDSLERVTVDVDIELGREPRHCLRGIAIVEVKQPRLRVAAPMIQALKSYRIRPSSASKYCTAIALTEPDVRMNRLLPALSTIRSMRL